MHLLTWSIGFTWFILLASCAYTIRESEDAMERARSWVVLIGALSLPVIPTFLLISNTHDRLEIATTFLWLSAAVLPLPVGIAVSRYNLFDLGWDARKWIGHLVYAGTGALFLSCAFKVSVLRTSNGEFDLSLVFVISLLCMTIGESVRGRIMIALESRLSPASIRLRRLQEYFEREISELYDEEKITHALGGIIQRAISTQSGCLFLEAAGDWRPAFAFGRNPAARRVHLSHSLSLLGARRVVHLALEPTTRGIVGELRAAEVEAIVAIRGRRDPIGVLLISGKRDLSPYSGAEMDFLEYAAKHAGIALRNSRMSRVLINSERRAASGRASLALAHEVGKELDWARRLLKRLPNRLNDIRRVERDIERLSELADGMDQSLRQFVNEFTAPDPEAPGIMFLDDIVEAAIRKAERVHQGDRIIFDVSASMRSMRYHENLVHVIFNLLDNALHASSPPDPVLVSVDLSNRRLIITISDAGCGLPDEEIDRLFEPGFSAQEDGNGLGIGLMISKEIVESFGGTIVLRRRRQKGTRAVIDLPAKRLTELASI